MGQRDDGQRVGNACLPRSAASSARRPGGSDSYRWISGPITTVPVGHTLPKASAVAGAGDPAWKWFSESSRSSSFVYGNHPRSVRRIGHTKLMPCQDLQAVSIVLSSPSVIILVQYIDLQTHLAEKRWQRAS
jgi:hypothetical protein